MQPVALVRMEHDPGTEFWFSIGDASQCEHFVSTLWGMAALGKPFIPQGRSDMLAWDRPATVDQTAVPGSCSIFEPMASWTFPSICKLS